MAHKTIQEQVNELKNQGPLAASFKKIMLDKGSLDYALYNKILDSIDLGKTPFLNYYDSNKMEPSFTSSIIALTDEQKIWVIKNDGKLHNVQDMDLSGDLVLTYWEEVK